MRLGISKPSQYHLDALKKKMVPQGNWMRLLMCDGKVERRWGTYKGTSEASTKVQRDKMANYTLIGAAVLRRWCLTIKKNGDKWRYLY